MRHVNVLLMPLDNGYRAAAGSFMLDTRSLDRFGDVFEKALRGAGEDVEITWALSKSLRPQFDLCATCGGAERVEILGSVAAQTMSSVYSALDLSKRATRRCPTCRGLGVTIPEFWQTSASA